MKQLFLTPFFILITLICLSQTDKIQGIGIYKIGSTIAVLNDAINLYGQPEIKNTSHSYNSNREDFIELQPNMDDLNDSPIYANYNPSIKVFELANYTVAGINLSKLRISFYKDTLFLINCAYSSELIEAFTLKYGEPVLTTDTITFKCETRPGLEIILEGQIHYSKWTNGDIEATAALGNLYTRNCEKQILSYIIIRKIDTTTITNELDSTAKKEIKLRLDNSKKAGLKDL